LLSAESSHTAHAFISASAIGAPNINRPLFSSNLINLGPYIDALLATVVFQITDAQAILQQAGAKGGEA
jgi:hypothetical protein